MSTSWFGISIVSWKIWHVCKVIFTKKLKKKMFWLETEEDLIVNDYKSYFSLNTPYFLCNLIFLFASEYLRFFLASTHINDGHFSYKVTLWKKCILFRKVDKMCEKLKSEIVWHFKCLVTRVLTVCSKYVFAFIVFILSQQNIFNAVTSRSVCDGCRCRMFYFEIGKIGNRFPNP